MISPESVATNAAATAAPPSDSGQRQRTTSADNVSGQRQRTTSQESEPMAPVVKTFSLWFFVLRSLSSSSPSGDQKMSPC
ncbi:unnamed protein product [Boreogadus saida]